MIYYDIYIYIVTILKWCHRLVQVARLQELEEARQQAFQDAVSGFRKPGSQGWSQTGYQRILVGKYYRYITLW